MEPSAVRSAARNSLVNTHDVVDLQVKVSFDSVGCIFRRDGPYKARGLRLFPIPSKHGLSELS